MSTIAVEREKIETINPATGESIRAYEQLTDGEINDAIEKCHEAFTKWRSTSHEERGEHLKKIAQALKDHSEELSELMTQEMGKLLQQSKQEIELCAAICNYTAEKWPGGIER